MNIALIGPSGSGKGTHASRLVADFDFIRISTGDLFHDHLEHKTALGLLARNYMNRGELVPDEVTDAMVEESLGKVPADKGILFDGFPRTLAQALFLDEILHLRGQRLDGVVYLKVRDDVALGRLTGRLICPNCQASYHARFHPPTQPGRCDVCGGGLHHRPDDEVESARARLGIFHRTIDPVLYHYHSAGRLTIEDAEGAPAEVYRVLAGLLRQKEWRATTMEELETLKVPEPVILPATHVLRPSLDLVLLGGPGSGKGTQAEHICRDLALPHISTGDLFRENLKQGTSLGKLAKSYMDRGELVPDGVTEDMVAERLKKSDAADGFLLDGFPRTLAQAKALDEILTAAERRLSGAILIDVSDTEIIKRLGGRRICTQCQASYHLEFKPPHQPGLCDHCGGVLGQRDDDNPATIKARLKTFHAQIEPLLDYYRQRGLLATVQGEGAPVDISQRTIAAAQSLKLKGNLLCSKPPS